MIGWVLFRSDSLDFAFAYIGKLFSFTGGNLFLPNPDFIRIILIAVFFAFITKFKFGQKLNDFFFQKQLYNTKQHILLSGLSLILLLLSISFIISSDFNPFIYFRF
jgi:alginate O-acetyltransferase complex protein AlgI